MDTPPFGAITYTTSHQTNEVYTRSIGRSTNDWIVEEKITLKKVHPITLSKVVFSSASRCSGRRGRRRLLRSSSSERRNLINMICASSCAFYSPEGDSKTEGKCLSPSRVGVSFLVS